LEISIDDTLNRSLKINYCEHILYKKDLLGMGGIGILSQTTFQYAQERGSITPGGAFSY